MRFLAIFTVISLVFTLSSPARSMSLFLNSFTSDKAKLSYYCHLIYGYVTEVRDGEPAEYVSVDDVGHVNNMLSQLNDMKLSPSASFKAQAKEQIELYDPQRVALNTSEEFFKGEFFGCKSAMSYHVVSTYQQIERRPDVVEKAEPKKEKKRSPWSILFDFIF